MPFFNEDVSCDTPLSPEHPFMGGSIEFYRGPKGEDGHDGVDGISPTVDATEIVGGHRVTITDTDGAHVFDVMDGEEFDIHSLTAENAVADSDELPFYDDSVSAPRKTTWSNIKAKLKSYFDTLYNKVTKTSDLTNDSGYISDAPSDSKEYARKNGAWAEVVGGGGTSDYTDLENKPSINGVELSGNKTTEQLGIEIPSLDGYATEEWVEGKGYLTEHQSLAGYATESYVQSYHDSTKQNVINDLATIRSGAELGATALQSVPNTYRTASAQDAIDNGKVDKVSGKGLSSNDYTDADKAKVASAVQPSGLDDYAKTDDVPTKLSQLTSDSTHRTVTDAEKSTWNGKSDFSGDYNDLSNKPTIPSAYDDTAIKARVTAIEGKESTWDAKYSKPSSGIPKTDLASAVQTSLGKADSALQEHQSLANYYTKSQVDTSLSGKANSADIPTDAHINSLIDDKLNALDGNGAAY